MTSKWSYVAFLEANIQSLIHWLCQSLRESKRNSIQVLWNLEDVRKLFTFLLCQLLWVFRVFFFSHIDGASRLRVCYQRGQPHLDFFKLKVKKKLTFDSNATCTRWSFPRFLTDKSTSKHCLVVYYLMASETVTACHPVLAQTTLRGQTFLTITKSQVMWYPTKKIYIWNYSFSPSLLNSSD